eukprot:3804375-Prorocentrum_lima.AAC.1
MTSSLVGSEMCIRDRLHRALTSQTAPPSLHRGADCCRWGAARARRLGPVSYTHLTLPTICSV